MPDVPSRPPWTISVVRFAIELAAWIGTAWWGWTMGDGGVRGGLLAAAFFIASAGVWGIFGVRNDPARNPEPAVAVPGWTRLAIEVAVIVIGAIGIWVSESRAWAETLLTVAAVTYGLTYDRVYWLLTGRVVNGFQRREPDA
jgi:hypothetical protein